VTECVIYNPEAGRGLTRHRIEGLHRSGGSHFAFFPTAGAGHATELAERAIRDGFTTIIAAGGDGTVHEVANGVLLAGNTDATFAVWPAGSANDYAYALGLEPDWPLRPDVRHRMTVRAVDVGRVTADGGRTTYFVNGLGLGFNSAVTLESRRIPRLRGLARYGLAFLQAVAWHYHSPPLSIAFDVEMAKERRTLAFTVSLGQREGGFLLTPQARLDDGLFDFIHAGPISRLRALRMLPRMVAGTLPHDDPLLQIGRCRSVRVTAGHDLCVHVDGEFFCQPEDGVRGLSVEMLPGRLRVLSGSG
jgi:diacylglycerol kinase (ATP)